MYFKTRDELRLACRGSMSGMLCQTNLDFSERGFQSSRLKSQSKRWLELLRTRNGSQMQCDQPYVGICQTFMKAQQLFHSCESVHRCCHRIAWSIFCHQLLAFLWLVGLKLHSARPGHSCAMAPGGAEYTLVPVSLVSGESVEIKLLPGSTALDLRLVASMSHLSECSDPHSLSCIMDR